MFYGLNSLFIAYEFIDMDLTKILQHPKYCYDESIAKGLLLQFLSGLAKLHEYQVIHRDIKPENLLISRKGNLKIADFGFARFIASPNREMTAGVVSDWYRPPEIFFGSTYYSYSVDIWSAGCIFAEFFQKEPLFRGNGEIEILEKIFFLLGVPNVFLYFFLNVYFFFKSKIIGPRLFT